ncbi:hypothetical protein CLAFUW4_10280 [Fulvia fulva]|uniref:Uncharacterized protein n=1 Tax=Passalora fulva TaxID=5499 RepID=A0A9Q8P7S9_PASFU|nr:uncharacterized protein CLAFUR5_04892 [Fulvia fulva]KAK4615886.1 hypothetical protein CLAFUR4_10284 [Fulvia fulva]KAK4616867.1 hypothetical protein CLAFUR0_10282 [Fulvia fulva]UJO16351.1 hypothetical protein CLAFUR5_04892 [Fulvia fulva]WPV18923.1 hypothetical protein CLAFUW4_10280 [Fulvia fulva]WPV34272.1 hypothetical protein CLAFUW7_10280 [Fulvia fulva]
MRYQVVKPEADDEAGWEQLRSSIQQGQDVRMQASDNDEDDDAMNDEQIKGMGDLSIHNDNEDAEAECEDIRGDPALLYQYDRGEDLSWLTQLTPQRTKIT